MKTIKLFVALLLVGWGDMAFSQGWNVIMMYRNTNPIILDSNWYEKGDDFVLFDFGLKSRDMKSWDMSKIYFSDIPSENQVAKGADKISIYDLRNFTSYTNGVMTAYRDSISPPPHVQSISMSGYFLAGTGYKVTASLPKDKKGIFTFKVTLRASMVSSPATWDTLSFIQTVYVGVEPQKLSIGKIDLVDVKICQDQDQITIKNIPFNSKVQIFDIKGSQVFEESQKEEIIVTRNLSPGIYTLVIGDGIFRKKFAITH